LEASGYVVTRAAGSMVEFDLVGIGATDFVLVQVRSRDWPRPAGTRGVGRACGATQHP
jgi:hypothetical protein